VSATWPSVWAPSAASVELVLGDVRHPMRAEGDGWWVGPCPIAPGTDYAFAVDGGEPLPDPRSPWQPAGVHGPSRTVDHAAFAWTDDGWSAPPLADAVIYELHVGTFTPDGTFASAIDRLDDLVQLGVTHLELLPVAEYSGDRGWGYDGVDLYAPHHAYGGPDGLKRLVDAAHARGLAVLLDVVYNHLGPEGNHLARFGPYFTDRYTTAWGPAVNFDDRGSHEVRRFVTDNALMWLRDYHFDGLRLDAVHAIFDMSAVHIGEELTAAVRGLERDLARRLVVTAESDLNDPRCVQPPELGGYGMDAAWADDVHHAIHVALTGETDGYYADFTEDGELPRALCDPYLYDGRYAPARDRHHGRSAGDLPGHRFIACIQNHDQVGNRARGDRLAHLVSEGRARIGAALLLTSPYVPFLFAGEEWAASSPFPYFASHEDPGLAAAVSAGRREEFVAFGWDPDAVPDPHDPATFAMAKLDWAEREREPHAGMLAWYSGLIALRREIPGLRDGDRAAVSADGSPGGLLIVRRGPISVLANLGGAPVRTEEAGEVRLAWPPDASPACLPPDGVVVLDRR
jgi:maltooligosyltrehalose trehalohydrolase